MSDPLEELSQAFLNSCTLQHTTILTNENSDLNILSTIIEEPEQETLNMAAPQISVKDYLELIPKFDGEPTQLSTFIKACESVLTLMAPKAEVDRIGFTMMHIRTKIIGKASLMLAARHYSTFNELRQILISLFGDQRNEESLLRDLTMFRQKPNETTLQFADRCIDLRCLLLNKLECSPEANEIKAAKRELYNATTLRSYLAGLNANMSHLLRCKSPATIEDAIRMVVDEENMNYHRIQLQSHTGSSSKSNPKIPNHQLKINPMPVRNYPSYQTNFSFPPTNYAPRHTMPAQIPPQFSKPNWTPRPFPTPQPHLFNNNQPRPQTFQRNRPPSNVFKSNPQRQLPNPTPMDTSSSNTRIKPKFPQQYTVEELYHQEANQPESELNNYEYSYDEYFSERNENPEEYEYWEPAEENFTIPASDTPEN